MAILANPLGLWFGEGCDVPLPEGWKLREDRYDFAKAEDPQGKLYYVGREAAYPVLKNGWMDAENPVSLRPCT